MSNKNKKLLGDPENSNSRTDKLARRRANLRCTICPPHRYENESRRKPRDDRHKNHRRK